jgi:protein ImuA
MGDRAAALASLRHSLARGTSLPQSAPARLPFGLAPVDSHLPHGGLACGALHEIVPARQAAFPAALGLVVAVLARFHSPARGKVLFVMPAHGTSHGTSHGTFHGTRQCGRLSGHGLNSLGFDLRRAILVSPSHRQDILWAMVEGLRSQAPQAVVGIIDRLDLKTSQKLHLAAVDAGLPLFLLRPSQNLESSAAATRWRIATAASARDRFGSYARARWRLQLERCRNGRPGEWVVEYDHVAHRFSLVAALADLSVSRGAGEESRRQAGRS